MKQLHYGALDSFLHRFVPSATGLLERHPGPNSPAQSSKPRRANDACSTGGLEHAHRRAQRFAPDLGLNLQQPQPKTPPQAAVLNTPIVDRNVSA
ncbi:hypothetical protein [Caballeronia sp. RCC_10]|uniref:hypothetical protein n=1 Tax=Caballeronia sp. RCC_10 TaxID=3239227 RepID=UPI003524CB51